MAINRTVNPCNPGHGASCALCCGSHNIHALHPPLQEFPGHRAGKTDLLQTECSDAQRHPLLYDDAMRCPYLHSFSTGCIGCSIYRDRSGCSESVRIFFDTVCAGFFCRAWDELSDDELIFAARAAGDWYYYSLLILDIPTLRGLHRRFGDGPVPPGEMSRVKQRLDLLILPPDRR